MSIYLLLAVIFWGFSYIAIKESLNYLSPVELIAARFATGAITLLLIIKLKGMSLSMRGEFKNLLISGIIVFVHFWIMATGMLYTTATNTAWILTTAPIFIAVLSIIVLSEKLHLGQGLAIIAATVGVLFLVSNGDFTTLAWISSIGDWIVLGSCVTWAIYTIFTRRITSRLDPLVATFWTIAISGLVIVPGSILFSGASVYLALPASGAIAVLFLGIGCLAGSFWFWSEGLKQKPAAEVGLYLYLEPLFATIGAAVLLNEEITWPVMVGGLFIFAAVYLAENFGKKKLGKRAVRDAH